MRSVIKAVTFDFGGTLVLGDLDKNKFDNQLFDYLRSIGFEGKKTRLIKAKRGVLEKLLKARSFNRELRIEDLYNDLLVKLGLHPEIEALNYIHELYMRSYESNMITGILEVLTTMKEKYKLAVISNSMSNLPRHNIMKFELGKFFDVIVVSRDLGVRKPDPEIFSFALYSLGIKGKEAAHVGDSLREDVLGAKRSGMKSIWIKSGASDMYINPNITIQSITELTSIL